MASKSTASTALLLVISALAVLGRYSTSVQRVDANRDARLSGDEVVYLLLGDRLWHERRYTTQGIERFLPLQRTIVPGYLQADVFKHPPVYPGLVGLSRLTFGGALQAAYYPNLVLAAISIAATFLLCRHLQVSPAFSLIGAALVAVSPVHWAASSRIWLDLPLATFMSLALLLHVRAAQSNRWEFVALAWCAAVLTKAVAAVPWLAATLATLALDREARRSRRFWIAQTVVVAALLAWFLVLTANENVLTLASRASRIDDARTLVRLVPLLLAAAVAGAAIVWWWHRTEDPAQGSASGVFWLASLAMVVIAMAGGLGSSLLDRPWTGWDANPLVSYGAAFYFVYPVLFDPVVIVGIVALLIVSDRPETLPVKAAWLALIAFLTIWGNYQTRYSLPLLQIEIVFATAMAAAAWNDSRRPTATRVLVIAWVAFSIIRSSWVVLQLRAGDFFYF